MTATPGIRFTLLTPEDAAAFVERGRSEREQRQERIRLIKRLRALFPALALLDAQHMAANIAAFGEVPSV